MPEMKENIDQIVQKLVREYGIELLQDANRMNAFLMDYAPRSEKERKLIILVIKEGIPSQLIKLKKESEEYQNSGIQKCIRQLASDMWITETAAQYAVMVLAAAMGIKAGTGLHEETEAADAQGEHNGGKMRILSKEMELISKEAIQVMLETCHAVGYKALAANTSIEEISLPKNIISIYPRAFLNCINLQRVCLPREIRSIGCCAFEGCTALKEIVIPEGANFKVLNKVLIDMLAKKALRVENHAGMESVSITNGITTICKKSFEHTEVKRIVIPMSVEKIEEDAFYMTMDLQNFAVDPKNLYFRTIHGVLHNREGLVLIRYPQGKEGVNYYLEDTVEEIGLQAFSCVRNIQTVTFTSALKIIGDKAFEYCSNLENLILPGSIEIIGERAFQYCEKLSCVMLSRNIREIGDCAFYNCISLESISVPQRVKRIGNLAFANCKNLKSVTIQENISFIGDGAFDGCGEIEIYVKNNPYAEIYCQFHGIVCNRI